MKKPHQSKYRYDVSLGLDYDEEKKETQYTSQLRASVEKEIATGSSPGGGLTDGTD